MAAIFILVAVVLDGFDGRVARHFGITSEFGKQLDSLCDLVSFGVAPSILMFVFYLNELQFLGILITMLFPLCGALRLARFNVMKGVNYFVGIPITMGGGILALLALLGEFISLPILAFLVVFLSLAMISKFKIPKL